MLNGTFTDADHIRWIVIEQMSNRGLSVDTLAEALEVSQTSSERLLNDEIDNRSLLNKVFDYLVG